MSDVGSQLGQGNMNVINPFMNQAQMPQQSNNAHNGGQNAQPTVPVIPVVPVATNLTSTEDLINKGNFKCSFSGNSLCDVC